MASDKVSRRSFVQVAGAAAGGLAVGAAGGYAARGSDASGSTGRASGGDGGGKDIVIGGLFPLTDAPADAEQMENGVRLAIEEVNAAGGVLGRKLALETSDISLLDANGIQTSFRQMAEKEPAAIYNGYVLAPTEWLSAAKEYGGPFLNASTQIAQVERIQQDGLSNVFQIDPPETYYGEGFPLFLSNLADGGTWKPANRNIYVLQGANPYSFTIGESVQVSAEANGWTIEKVVELPDQVTDWTQYLSDIRSSNPAAVMVTHFYPDQLAKLTQDWAANPAESLLYLQYGPSIPQYLEIAQSAADGVIWSTVTGTLPDTMGVTFQENYASKFNGSAGFSNAGSGYDAVHMLAKAWNQVGDTADFEKVSDALRSMVHRGVNGGYAMPDNVALSYPSQTKDPSLGNPYLFYQIFDGKHRAISPDPYIESAFELAPWMK